MSKFCGQCGASLQEGFEFCGSCGASTQQQTSPSQPQAFQPVAQPAAPQPAPVTAVVPKASSPWLKIVLIVVLFFFVCGAAAVDGFNYFGHSLGWFGELCNCGGQKRRRRWRSLPAAEQAGCEPGYWRFHCGDQSGRWWLFLPRQRNRGRHGG